MSAAPDSIIVTGETFEQVTAGHLLVTPTGGSQGLLADLLTTATGGAVSATTLTASGAITLNPANANVSIAPTGTGTHAINNMTVGVTTPAAGAFTTLSATSASTLQGVTATTLTATGATVLSNASITIANLPTADPHVAGRLWANVGVVTVSAG